MGNLPDSVDVRQFWNDCNSNLWTWNLVKFRWLIAPSLDFFNLSAGAFVMFSKKGDLANSEQIALRWEFFQFFWALHSILHSITNSSAKCIKKIHWHSNFGEITDSFIGDHSNNRFIYSCSESRFVTRKVANAFRKLTLMVWLSQFETFKLRIPNWNIQNRTIGNF